MTDADHFAINAWMLFHGFQWVERVHPDGGQWTYIHPDVGVIQLTQAAAAFAFFQFLKGANNQIPQPIRMGFVSWTCHRVGCSIRGILNPQPSKHDHKG